MSIYNKRFYTYEILGVDDEISVIGFFFRLFVSGEGLAPIVSAYSRLILVDGTVL